MNILTVKNLNWSYNGRNILKEISFSLKKGTFVSILGPNGSGKTTLLKNIIAYLTPRKNTVIVGDSDIVDLKAKERAKKLAYLPQGFHTDMEFTVHDVVLMGRNPYIGRFASETSKDLKIAEDCMRLTKVYELMDRKITELSGGELQRVLIARALAQEPEILLMYEPVSHLDLHHQIFLLDLFGYLVKERGLTILCVLHDINLAASYSDYIILIKDGEIKKYGEPLEVLTKENIEEVYGTEVLFLDNPYTRFPLIIPKGCKAL